MADALDQAVETVTCRASLVAERQSSTLGRHNAGKTSLQSPAKSSKLQSALDAMRQQEAPGSHQKPDAEQAAISFIQRLEFVGLPSVSQT
jgi:hypothetical protein